jgi:tagatose-1,6-bisphosphate aldolase non-catalytic subunit AgaZ/GatZ
MSSHTSKSGSAWLREIVNANRSGQPVGLYSVCSAHPSVLRAAMQQALDDDSMLSPRQIRSINSAVILD